MIAEPKRKEEASFPARTQPMKNHRLFFTITLITSFSLCKRILLPLLWGDWLTTHHGFRSWSAILCRSQVNPFAGEISDSSFQVNAFTHKFLCGHVFLSHFDTCLGVESMGHVVILGLIFEALPDCFPEWLHRFLFSASSVWGLQSLHILIPVILSLLILAILVDMQLFLTAVF